MPRIEANKIKGLIKALDRRKITQPFIYDGKNFLVDVDGPYSGLSRTQLSAVQNGSASPALVAPRTLYIDSLDISFYMDADRLSVLNNRLSGSLVELVRTNRAQVAANWSYALVGGAHYFAQPGFGLFKYTVTAGFTQVNQETFLGGVFGICESGGRLVVAAPGVVAWSVIDDGERFLPSVTTGAGFQSLAILGSSQLSSLYGLFRTTDGFMLFTAEGILKSILTGTQVVFRHKRLPTKYLPISAVCLAQAADDSIIYLSTSGLYRSAGEAPVLWQPLMSEYLRVNIVNKPYATVVGAVALNYVDVVGWTVVSFSDTDTPFAFSRSLIHTEPSDEWGSFDRLAAGFGELKYNGVVVPAHIGSKLHTLFVFTNTTYDLTAQYTLSNNTPLYTYTRKPLDSSINVGMFRLLVNEHASEWGALTDVQVGMLETANTVADTLKDYEVGTPDVFVDYMLPVTPIITEDWSNFSTGISKYKLVVSSTADGNTPLEGQTMEGLVALEDKFTRFFDCDTTGLYHTVALSTVELYDYYHVKTLELTGYNAGRAY